LCRFYIKGKNDSKTLCICQLWL